MKHYLFHVKAPSSVEEAERELATHLEHLYIIEDPDTQSQQIGGYSNAPLPSSLDHSLLVEEGPAHEVNWLEQWQQFAPDFRDDAAHILLSNGQTLKLQAGGGFGDLSHPTTNLTLALMTSHIASKTVIDIGCGSGILSIAALLLGADLAIGIDIDPAAIVHSQTNADLNQVSNRAIFTQTIDSEHIKERSLLIAMNMIRSEQQQAWDSLPRLHSQPATIITSGILAADREAYLELTREWGWGLLEEAELDGWIGFLFINPAHLNAIH
ncbi:MAG: 50S ribosomal protein L11 methyltransferase [Chlamydiota bacterium]